MKFIKSTVVLVFFLILGCESEDSININQSQNQNQQNYLKKQRIERIDNNLSQDLSIVDFSIERNLNINDQESYMSVREKFNYSEKKKSIQKSKINIYPTGIFPDDWENIQAAIDFAGENNQDIEIILHAAKENGEIKSFNLGSGTWPNGRSISILGSDINQSGRVIIKGESYQNKMATLEGGEFGFFNNIVAFALGDREYITFKELKFKGTSVVSPVYIYPSPDNVLIKDCEFEDYFQFRSVGSYGNNTSYTIKGCTFRNVNIPAQFLGNHNDVVIKDNKVVDCREGFILGNAASGNFLVQDNEIHVFNDGSNYNLFGGLGIGLYTRENAIVNIVDNNIFAEGPVTSALFIYDFSGKVNNVTIRDNKIKCNSEFFGVFDAFAINGNGISDICVSNNSFSGSATTAIYAEGFYSDLYPPSEITNISYTNNDLSDFTTNCYGIDGDYLPIGCADVFFGEATSNIVYCGSVENLIDRGINNLIVEMGCKSCK